MTHQIKYIGPYVIETGIPLPKPAFPGGSKTRVSRAGNAIRTGSATPEDYQIIDTWRAAHRNVLNTFQALLRTRTRGQNIVVAQRLKRRKTVFGKLNRYPSMELSRMDDVAGCRLIFPTLEELYTFRQHFNQGSFKHKLRNDPDKWDYIKRPKPTGYRGIHDVYEYDVNSEQGRDYKGLLLEVQYRTAAQHAWATCVEVVGFLTESQPKFQQGDKRYETAMAYASELIARYAEQRSSCLPDTDSPSLVSEFSRLESELGLLKLLRGLNAARNHISNRKDMILIFEDDHLVIRDYRRSAAALQALFKLESETRTGDVVYVRADKGEDVRNAFRNYFSDATEFLSLIDQACAYFS
ncbi:MAG: RelA/SpoT domain-containing protein [Janthinobacterium lividum]